MYWLEFFVVDILDGNIFDINYNEHVGVLLVNGHEQCVPVCNAQLTYWDLMRWMLIVNRMMDSVSCVVDMVKSCLVDNPCTNI